MSELRVRNVDPWVLDWYRSLARNNRRSLEGVVRDALAELARRQADELRAELSAGLDRMRDRYGVLPDSAALIREDRDERG